MTKKLIALFLAAVMLLSFAACGKEESDKKADEKTTTASDKPNGGKNDTLTNIVDEPGYVFKNEDSVELQAPSKTIDVQSIYDNLEYNEKMFMGSYINENCLTDEGCLDFAEEVGYIPFKTNYAENLTSVPYKIVCGINNIAHRLSDVSEYEWARFSYYSDKGYLIELVGAISVEGKKLTFTPVDTFEVNSDTKKITYAFMNKSIE